MHHVTPGINQCVQRGPIAQTQGILARRWLGSDVAQCNDKEWNQLEKICKTKENSNQKQIAKDVSIVTSKINVKQNPTKTIASQHCHIKTRPKSRAHKRHAHPIEDSIITNALNATKEKMETRSSTWKNPSENNAKGQNKKLNQAKVRKTTTTIAGNNKPSMMKPKIYNNKMQSKPTEVSFFITSKKSKPVESQTVIHKHANQTTTCKSQLKSGEFVGWMCPSGMSLLHPLADLLLGHATKGCRVNCGKNWSLEQL